MNDPSTPSIALYGPSFVDPGQVEVRTLGERSACSISVGALAAITRKKPEAAPNEDALYLHDDGQIAVHVVADGHYGTEASQALVQSMAEIFDRQGTQMDLSMAYGKMAQAWRQRPDQGQSRSTMIIASLDRGRGTVQGFTIGDSACFLVGPAGITRLDTPSRNYVAPWDYYSLGVPPSSYFEAEAPAGSVFVCCTDGVTECHYGEPESSIQPEDIAEIVSRTGTDPKALVEALGVLALTGVRDQPGGEDNFAITVSIA